MPGISLQSHMHSKHAGNPPIRVAAAVFLFFFYFFKELHRDFTAKFRPVATSERAPPEVYGPADTGAGHVFVRDASSSAEHVSERWSVWFVTSCVFMQEDQTPRRCGSEASSSRVRPGLTPRIVWCSTVHLRPHKHIYLLWGFCVCT